ncbi:MAG: hypothetical protein M1514_01815 [Patescibacteria group bacterium]|nr:hypothetical protein [Patescibacteria group bacterium]
MANTNNPGVSEISSDHDEVKKWAEERGGVPSIVKGTGGEGKPGILRFDFPDVGPKANLEHISWDEFFKVFDEKDLALLYQEKTSTGEISRFNKFVSRSCLEEEKD